MDEPIVVKKSRKQKELDNVSATVASESVKAPAPEEIPEESIKSPLPEVPEPPKLERQTNEVKKQRGGRKPNPDKENLKEKTTCPHCGVVCSIHALRYTHKCPKKPAESVEPVASVESVAPVESVRIKPKPKPRVVKQPEVREVVKEVVREVHIDPMTSLMNQIYVQENHRKTTLNNMYQNFLKARGRF